MDTTKPQTYTVKAGQSRSSIARELGVPLSSIGMGRSGNADLIFPGEQISINSTMTGNTPQQGTPTIPSSIVSSPIKPVNLPPAPQPTQAGQLSGTAGGYLSMPTVNNLNQLGQANQVAQQNANLAQEDYRTQTLSLLDAMQNRPGQLAEEYNIQQLNADFLQAKSKYDGTQLAYRRQKEATTTNPALSADQKQSRINEIERKEASQLADIAIDYNLKQGLLSSAKELMNEQIKLELEPMKLKVDFYREIKDDYQDVLNNTQKAQLDRLMKQEERAYQSAQQDKELLNDLKLQAYKDGKINLSDFGKIKSFSDFDTFGISTTDALAEAGARSTIETIDNALNNKRGLMGAVGTGLFSRASFLRGKVKQEFIGDVQQIAGQLTIDKLIAAKGSGATFGALSDGERELLAAASTRLGTWAVRDKDGKITGWKVGENTVKEELRKIKEFAILDYERRTGQTYVPPPQISEYNGYILPTVNTATYNGFQLPN